MSMSFSVKVVDSHGSPKSGVRVYADFGLWNGGLTEYTGDDGWAEFNTAGDYVTMELFVDGENYGHHPVSDGETYSFTLS